MPFSGATLINNLARRIRDTANVGHSRVFLLEVLNRCSYALNAATRSKIATASFTPTAEKTLYQVTDAASNVIKIIGIRDIGGRDLMEVPWDSLVLNDSKWLRRVGGRPEMFATIGRDLFVVYPAQKAGSPQALTVLYVKQPTDLIDGAGNWELPDELEPILLDLAEVLVYLRGRIFNPPTAISEPLARIAQALGIEMTYAVQRHNEEK